MKVPVTNNKAAPIYVGAYMIPAGETRHFEEEDVPPHLRPQPVVQPVVEEPKDPLALLAARPVKEIQAALPELKLEELERLGELEQLKGEAGRKTLLSAIAEELLKRAESGAQR